MLSASAERERRRREEEVLLPSFLPREREGARTLQEPGSLILIVSRAASVAGKEAAAPIYKCNDDIQRRGWNVTGKTKVLHQLYMNRQQSASSQAANSALGLQ